MKIAFVGKGGAGKTTLAALFTRHLAAQGRTVWAIDADINQNLAAAFGEDPDEEATRPTLGEHLDEIKDYLRGDNPRISSTGAMVKTTPPGRGSRLLRVVEDNPIYRRCVRTVDGVRLAATGGFAGSDLGVACYHSKVGAVELILNHLVDAEDEYVVVDMTAGADAFASGAGEPRRPRHDAVHCGHDTAGWDRLTRQAVEFHLRNAAAWANERTGRDLAEQVDPEFTLAS
jgi:CO dehydrogenase maturation factor